MGWGAARLASPHHSPPVPPSFLPSPTPQPDALRALTGYTEASLAPVTASLLKLHAYMVEEASGRGAGGGGGGSGAGGDGTRSDAENDPPSNATAAAVHALSAQDGGGSDSSGGGSGGRRGAHTGLGLFRFYGAMSERGRPSVTQCAAAALRDPARFGLRAVV